MSKAIAKEKKKFLIKFDPTDREAMEELMRKYGEQNDLSGWGENDKGEEVNIDIYTDHITVKTYQANKWVRINTYWNKENGYGVEEMFDGKWE